MAKGLRSNRGMALRAVRRATVTSSSWYQDAEQARIQKMQQTVEAGKAARAAREAEIAASASEVEMAGEPTTDAAPMDVTDGNDLRAADPQLTRKERKEAARLAWYKVKKSQHGRVDAQFYGKGHKGLKFTGKRMHKRTGKKRK